MNCTSALPMAVLVALIAAGCGTEAADPDASPAAVMLAGSDCQRVDDLVTEPAVLLIRPADAKVVPARDECEQILSSAYIGGGLLDSAGDLVTVGVASSAESYITLQSGGPVEIDVLPSRPVAAGDLLGRRIFNVGGMRLDIDEDGTVVQHMSPRFADLHGAPQVHSLEAPLEVAEGGVISLQGIVDPFSPSEPRSIDEPMVMTTTDIPGFGDMRWLVTVNDGGVWVFDADDCEAVADSVQGTFSSDDICPT